MKKFWNGYWIQAAASLVLGIVTTLLIFSQFNVAKPGVGLEASVKLFCFAFGFGFGCNSIIAEAAKWTGHPAVGGALVKATEKGKTK